MKRAVQKGEKIGHRLILLLVVALVAFSSAMKELNQLQQLGQDAGRLITQLSDVVVPTESPSTVVRVAEAESCDSEATLDQSDPSVELPWLSRLPVVIGESRVLVDQSARSETRKIERGRSHGLNIPKLRPAPRVAADPFQFEVRILTHDGLERNVIIPSDSEVTVFKAKSRKHGAAKVNPRDREMLLKTLNRSLNLRIAS